MTEPRPTRAIILAAGTGSRLGERGDSTPKPLRCVAGVPLLVRVLRTLQGEGIREAVIVIGHEGERIRQRLMAEPSLALTLRFVENREYLKKNGVSLLAAREWVDQPCLLSMSDHLYSPELVRRLLAAELPSGACGLAVDYDIERCFDLDDATKVRREAGRIVNIGKELESYDCLDTGVFRIGPALISELERVHEACGDASLSDGVLALTHRGDFFACDVGEARWIDVDTPEALSKAETMIHVFGDHLGDEPGTGQLPQVDPEAMELFAPSWVRAAKPYNEDHFAIADSGDVQRMMSNESPYAPSPRVLQAIMEAAMRGHQYPAGATQLRDRLGKRDGFAGENVILGAGSTELIDVVIRTFVSPGEEVLLSVPTFSMYEARCRAVGGVPILVPMSVDREHDVPSLIRAVTERTKVVFLCTPNNPTGDRIAESDLRRLLRLGLPTVIDEAYIEFSDGPSFVSLLREFPNAIVLRTFSKALGFAGLRLGYAIGHQALVRLLSRVKIPWNVSVLTLAAAHAVLEDEAEQSARVRELKASREVLVEEISRLPGVTAIPSEANFVLVDISATAWQPDELVAAVLKRGILIRSLTSHHESRRYVRVSVGTAEQNAACITALRHLLGAHTSQGLELQAELAVQSSRGLSATPSPSGTYRAVVADAE